ncbi:uncharacterized protein LOC117536421 [Gymnodraco acuticeps]|uniref:Uncharacterized protein LOC117536421 n=1 Tax=Gymnodraco acuticeps TaxID=8218 RepID=A0A6P8T1H2_GYMAC|nr:uncharacterized protein LOC117536421 [Gymnodraco acuticeps]
MSGESQGREASCQAEESVSWKQCIICQSDDDKKGVLVQHPKLESYGLVLQAVQERASLNDGDYVQVQRRLQNCTLETLCTEQAVWHRSCHSNATNNDQIQRARDRNAHALTRGHYTAKKRGQKRGSTEIDDPDLSTFSFSSPFTRSYTSPLNKEQCFFCQKDDGQQLYQVRTENAGKHLKEAVEMSHNTALKTRLNTCISPGDAHAIDVQYHNVCWRKNVFHALREPSTSTSKTAKEPFLQKSSLLELINLIDVETQNQAYLSMDDIETTYINMLGSEVLETHLPAFSRKWLKERILTALPHLKSVRQKDRRKPAILYSPYACEEDMVNTMTTTDKKKEENSMKTIYKAAQVIRKSIATFTKERNVLQVSSDITDVPAELYTMIHWIMVGPAEK